MKKLNAIILFIFSFFISFGSLQIEANAVSFSIYSTEDFETGYINPNWRLTGNGTWAIATDQVRGGTYSAKITGVPKYGTASMSITIENMSAGQLTYYTRINSSSNSNICIYIDGVYKGYSYGGGWVVMNLPISAGTHTFEWKYLEYGTSPGSGWIDNISFSQTITEPTTQASEVNFTSVGYDQATVNWTSGDGAYRKVFMKAGDTGTATPVDATAYTASTTFGSGTQIETSGWYCIYDGTGSSTTVTGLSASTSYIAQVFEYNGTSGYNENYLTSVSTNNPKTQATGAETQASNITFSSIGYQQMTINWDAGNGSSRIVFMKAGSTGTASPVDGTYYSSYSSFENGSQIGSSGWYAVYSGSGTSTTVSNLDPNTSYIVQVFEYNSSNNEYMSVTGANNPMTESTSAVAQPTVQSSEVTFSTPAQYTQMTVNWVDGDGENRVVFMKEGSGGDAAPVDGTYYYPYNYFQYGNQIGSSGWYAIYNTGYNGTANSVTVYDLDPSTTYTVQVFEYNGPSYSENYLTTTTGNSASQATEIPVAPTSQATSVTFTDLDYDEMTLNWTNGDGESRIVFMKEASTGTASPVDGTYYYAYNKFGSGDQIGTSGWYTVYSGTESSVSVNSLSPSTTYIVQVIEFNGPSNSGHEVYQTATSTGNPNTQVTPTVAEPTTQASSVAFSSVDMSRATVSWTAGDGAQRAVFIKETSSDTASPVDGTTYSASTAYGSGTQIGTSGWYCIYNGTGSSVNVTGLTPSANYVAQVFEYNGPNGYQDYLSSTTGNSATTTTAEDAFFETGAFSPLSWSFSGDTGVSDWSITSSDKNSGTYSAKSGGIYYYQSSQASVNLVVTAEGNMSFYYKNPYYGKGICFYVNDVQKACYTSYTSTWTKSADFPLSTGLNELTWSYYGNSNYPTTGYAYIDSIVVPAYDTTTTYTLTYSADSNGSITGTNPQSVLYYQDGSAVTAVGNTGYRFSSWSDSSTDNPRTDEDVTADVTVTASFVPELVISTLSPADESTTASTTTDLVITFDNTYYRDGTLTAVTGKQIYLYTSTGSLIETISADDTEKVSITSNTVTINPSSTLTEESSYYIKMDAGAFMDSVSEVTYNGITSSTFWNFTVGDFTAPSLSSTNPSNQSTSVNASNSFYMYFYNEDYLSAVSGKYITIKKFSDNSTIEQIEATDTSKITITNVEEWGYSNIHIDLATTLEEEVTYYITIDSGAFVDDSPTPLPYAGISDDSTWRFTTGDFTAPVILSVSPADDATGVDVDSNLVIKFDDNIYMGYCTGSNVSIYKTLDNSLVQTIDVNEYNYDPNEISISGGVVTLNPSTLEAETEYYVLIDSCAFKNANSYNFAGISDSTTWNFTTRDYTAPTVSLLSPLDEATNVPPTVSPVITFDETVTAASSGNIYIYDSADTLISTIAANDTTQVTVSSNTVTINPTINLEENTSYYIIVDSGAFLDTSTNEYAGISESTTWNFTAGDFTAPTVSTYSPTNGATGVSTTINLTLNFTENVTAVSGKNIYIYNSQGTLVSTIAANDTQKVTVSSNAVTITDSTTTLSDTTSYYILIDQGAFVDTATNTNAYTGITSTTWTFTTGDFTGPTASLYSPLDNATNTSVTGKLTLTFNENVIAAPGKTITIRKYEDDSITETISSDDTTKVSVNRSTVTITPSSTLQDLTEYYINIESGAFTDTTTNANEYLGISDATTWSFETGDFTGPVLSGVTSTPSSTSVVISWTANESGNSQIDYGVNTSKSASTSKTTSNEITITGLLACTKYYYEISSADENKNSSTTSEYNFTTLGCTTTATATEYTEETIDSTQGGTIEATGLSLEVPISFLDSSATFQIRQFLASEVVSTTQSPTGREIVSSNFFEINALSDETTRASSFNNPISVTMTYTDEELEGLDIDVSSLWIYRYHNGEWIALDGCIIDTTAKTITCTTSSFSIFGIFAEPSVDSSSPSTTPNTGGSGVLLSPSKPTTQTTDSEEAPETEENDELQNDEDLEKSDTEKKKKWTIPFWKKY
jgi:hypothetical protein